MNKRINTKEQFIKQAKECLDFFEVDYSGEFVYLSNGGNSCICNPKTRFPHFAGQSINAIAIGLARAIGKPTKYIPEDY